MVALRISTTNNKQALREIAEGLYFESMHTFYNFFDRVIRVVLSELFDGIILAVCEDVRFATGVINCVVCCSASHVETSFQTL